MPISRTAVFATTTPKPMWAHNGHAGNILYQDGHAETLTISQAKMMKMTSTNSNHWEAHYMGCYNRK